MKIENFSLSLGLVTALMSCSVDKPLEYKSTSQVFDFIERKAGDGWCVMPTERLASANDKVKIRIREALEPAGGIELHESGVDLVVETKAFSVKVHDRFRDGVLPTQEITLPDGNTQKFDPYLVEQDRKNRAEIEETQKYLRGLAIAAVRSCQPGSPPARG